MEALSWISSGAALVAAGVCAWWTVRLNRSRKELEALNEQLRHELQRWRERGTS